MDTVLENDILSMLEKHEGCVSWMYADSNNPPVPTCGIGHAIFRSQDAAVLPFRRMSDQRPATAQEIISVWSKLKYQSGSVKIKADKSLFLLENDIESIAMKDLSRFQPIMDKTFPVFDSYPQSVQLGLWDMVWQLGSFIHFPKFVAYVKLQDWTGAAEQCYRPAASATRNADTKKLFLDAIGQTS